MPVSRQPSRRRWVASRRGGTPLIDRFYAWVVAWRNEHTFRRGDLVGPPRRANEEEHGGSAGQRRADKGHGSAAFHPRRSQAQRRNLWLRGGHVAEGGARRRLR